MLSCQTQKQQPSFVDGALEYCEAQIERSLEQLAPADYMQSPRNVEPGGSEWSQRRVAKDQWTAGFWPGVLWYGYEASGNEKILAEARKYTEALEFISYPPAIDHDLGFLMFCSYGNGYRLTGDESYKPIINRTSETLATLYNPNVGTILSWPREIKKFGNHNTIIDNMINLEMLFWSAENGGSEYLREVAINHADKTMENHFREDGSSYHVVVYDSISGNKILGCTHQGYADDSMWARGQGWAIYGYTMCYRFTKDQRYLDFAQKVTDIYLEKLPADMIPYWDFYAPDIPDAPRDASAAALVASALIELSDYVGGAKGESYFSAAEAMLKEMDSNYRSKNSPAFLDHATGHMPAGSEIDYSIVYADYYYIEALLRLKNYYAENI
ncbi:MAG: glycoside hydrolase family 88 protein [Rikenellaceae bacterium]